MLCTDLSKVKLGKGGIVIEPLPCKRWTCEYCAPKLRRAFIAKCLAGHPTTFITLTVRASYGTVPEQAARLVSAWRAVRQRWSRKHHGQKIPFIARLEPHPTSGRPHLHILCRAPYIPQRWLSSRMSELAGSPVCDIRAVKNRKHAAFYLAKYLGKDLATKYLGAKRWWRSHDYDQEPEREGRTRQLDSYVVKCDFTKLFAFKMMRAPIYLDTVDRRSILVDFYSDTIRLRC